MLNRAADFFSKWFMGWLFPEPAIPLDPMASKPVVDEAPWMKWIEPKIGWTEFTHDKELSKYWKYTTYKAKTVIGRDYAWCAMFANAALFETGYKGTENALAVSFSKESAGVRCDYKFGAIIVIRHPAGNHHVTFFHSWANKEKTLMKCLGGNQDNAVKISVYDISPGHEKVLSCRWPLKLT